VNDDAFDEFSFLPEQAADLELSGPLPNVRRLHLTLPDGRALSALRYGEDAPRVTFLHGAGLNAHTWDTTILALGLPALAVDLAGHGAASWRADADYSPHTLAPDVVAALQEWTDAPQLLVGHSLGGLTATAVAASHPELVEALVIVDITPGVNPDAGPRQVREFFAGPTDWVSRDELVDRALSFGLGGSRRAAERGVYLNSRVRADGRVEWRHHFAHLAAAAETPPDATETSAAPRSDGVAGLLPEAGWADVAAVKAPTTLIRGDHGYVTATDAEEFTHHAPGAVVLVVPAHHNVHEEIPGQLADLIRDVAAA
jgi:pimeloyl-ACP methyl ester carboxylesterase